MRQARGQHLGRVPLGQQRLQPARQRPNTQMRNTSTCLVAVERIAGVLAACGGSEGQVGQRRLAAAAAERRRLGGGGVSCHPAPFDASSHDLVQCWMQCAADCSRGRPGRPPPKQKRAGGRLLPLPGAAQPFSPMLMLVMVPSSFL